MKIKRMRIFIVDMILDGSSRDYTKQKVQIIMIIIIILGLYRMSMVISFGSGALVICERGNRRKAIPRETCIV